MEETKQQPLALRVCAELAGSFLLCFAIYAFSTWGSAVYGINIVFFALATGLAYAAVTAIFSRVSGGQLNPAITVASVLVSKTKILDRPCTPGPSGGWSGRCGSRGWHGRLPHYNKSVCTRRGRAGPSWRWTASRPA